VAEVKDTLWAGGGCIAQCEFGAGARPDNVAAVYRAWDQLIT
jgi:uroporphyrinogen decarboxylase